MQWIMLHPERGSRRRSVEKLAHRADHTTQQGIANLHAERLACGDDLGTRRKALHRADRRQDRVIFIEADNFRRQLSAVTRIAQYT